MAKKEKKEEEEQIQEPEAPKKKEKSGEIKLPMLLGIIGGTLLIIILAVRFLFLPYIAENISGQKPNADDKSKKEAVEKKEIKKTDNDEDIFTPDEKLAQFFETGRITTNPKMSTQFVVINLGITFFPKNEEVLKELKGEGKEKPKEGEGPLPPKIIARVKGGINSVLGSMTVEDLQSRRDSITSYIKNNLKPLFKEKHLLLKDVILQEFIIQ